MQEKQQNSQLVSKKKKNSVKLPEDSAAYAVKLEKPAQLLSPNPDSPTPITLCLLCTPLIPSAAIPEQEIQQQQVQAAPRISSGGGRHYDERQLTSAAAASRRGTPLSLSLSLPPGYTSPVSLKIWEHPVCLGRAP